MTLEQQLHLHPDVVDRALEDGDTVLLRLATTTYYSLTVYSLTVTGTRIWEGLKHGLTLTEISQRLQEEFDVDEERADRSILNLVNELSQQKLVSVLD